MSVTLAQIRQQCRERADMVESQFITDTELLSYINNSVAELHDLLVAAYCEDYYMNEFDFATTDKTQVLPSDFYKIRGLDVKVNNPTYVPVKRFNFNRRNQDASSFAWNLLGVPYLEYRLVGNNIMFNRPPTGSSQFRLWYYPKAVKLVDETDIYDDINGYIEYVIVDVAIKMLSKEETDVTVLAAQKLELKTRLEGMAQNRDANEPESVSDIYAEDGDFYGVGTQ